MGKWRRGKLFAWYLLRICYMKDTIQCLLLLTIVKQKSPKKIFVCPWATKKVNKHKKYIFLSNGVRKLCHVNNNCKNFICRIILNPYHSRFLTFLKVSSHFTAVMIYFITEEIFNMNWREEIDLLIIKIFYAARNKFCCIQGV